MRLRLRNRLTGAPGRPGWLIHPGAAVDMDFAGSRYFGRQLADLSVVRASSGYAQDLAGNWQAFGANIPRITNRGLLVESARTNMVRNNSMQGAVAGTPGTAPANWQIATSLTGLARSIVGIGTDAGIDYIDVRLAGTTTATTAFDINPEAWNAVPAATGQQWTGSAFLRVVGGTATGLTTCYLWLYELNSSAGFLATSGGQMMPTTTMARLIGTRTLSNASVAFVRPVLQLQFAAGASVDITLRIGWPQLEQGGYATSPIRTTGAAQTRAADVVSAALVGSSANYTLFGQARDSAFGGTVFEASDGSNSNRGLIQKTGLNVRRFVATAGSTVVDAIATPAGGWGAASAKVALAMGSGAVRAAFNGALLAAADDAVSVPASGPTRLGIGSSGNGSSSYFEGYIERVALIPARIANSELQAVTT